MEIRRTLSTDELLKRKRTNEKIQKIFVKIFIFFVLILMDLPIFYLIVNSFTTARITGTWNGFSMIPYQTLFNYAGNKYAQKIWNACGNTILVALVAGALATIVGTAGAIGTHYMKRKWNNDPAKKIQLLLEFAGKSRAIADPWYTGDFQQTYEDVLEGCTAFLKNLLEIR